MVMWVLIFIPVLFLIALRLYVKSTIVWDRSPTSLLGKTAIVTGSNTGIGFFTAQDFAKRGAKVILACRNKNRAETAKKKIIEATDNFNVHVRILDLSSLQSVRDFVERINNEEERLDILVNNAGVLYFEDITTSDGLDLSMQVNHFGPFLLTLLLIGLLKKSKPSRIINVSSTAARYTDLNVDNLNHYSLGLFSNITFTIYSKTKLCNILFTNEIARRLRGSGVTANSLHPGVIATEINRNFSKTLQSTKILQYFVKTPEEGAQTIIYLAVSKDVTETSGEYFDYCKIISMPHLARDEQLAKKLWKESEKFVNLSDEERVL